MSVRPDPHAIIEIERPGLADGQATVRWDSWEMPRLFKEVEVELVTNETSQAVWSFFDPSFRLIDAFAGRTPVPQSVVRVFLGYGENLGQPVFKGLLADVGRVEESTTFTAFDMAFKMKLLKRAGYKNKKDDLAIMKDLVTRNGLKFDPPTDPYQLEPHNAMMQDEQTDWEHMMERAGDAGYVVYVRHDTVFARRPAKTGVPVMTLRHKEDFNLRRGWDFQFHTPESLDGRPRKVKHVARGKAGKRAEGDSDVSARGREDVVLKRDVPGTTTKAKLTKRAQAQKELEREHAFEARVETTFPRGRRPDVRDTIATAGMGKLFSGKYIVDRATYFFAPGRLGLEMDLYRDVEE